MILIDFSGISIAPIASGYIGTDVNLVRHAILNTIRMYRQKFGKQYGEIVIVADAGGNWRKDVYPEYKGKRKSNREASKIDWDAAFKSIGQVLEDIEANFPYKVIRQWGCEADDSIAEIVKWTQEFGNWENVMIISADKDFRQLQKFDNVSQFSPMTKKLIKEDHPRKYLAEHILTGCSGDGVPNVLSDDDTFLVEGKRQNVLSSKKKAALLEDPKSLGEEVYRNWQRNKKMIDLTESSVCPENVKLEIINKFVSQDQDGNKSKVLDFLIQNRMKLLIEVAGDFI